MICRRYKKNRYTKEANISPFKDYRTDKNGLRNRRLKVTCPLYLARSSCCVKGYIVILCIYAHALEEEKKAMEAYTRYENKILLFFSTTTVNHIFFSFFGLAKNVVYIMLCLQSFYRRFFVFSQLFHKCSVAMFSIILCVR